VKSFLQATLNIVIGLLAAGVILLVSSQPRGIPIKLLPPPTPLPIQVHLTGEIENPGVYELPLNSRVQDAIREAGGLTKDADDQGINLSAILQDGQQIRIPGKTNPLNQDLDPDERYPDERSSNEIPYRININTASADLLETLPGIGPVIANEIINFRQAEGEFISIEEIQKVHGIGPIIYEGIKDLITVSDP